MQIIRKVTTGQKGVKILLDQYGARLVCVRYGYDDQKRKRLKIIELFIEESSWAPPERPGDGAWSQEADCEAGGV